MIELSIDAAELTGLEKALVALHRDQIPYAMSRALNDCAKAAALSVNREMAAVFDRPTKFTERAAVAPRAMAATKSHLTAEVTLRPVQAQYLRLEETGGTRTGAMNTRKSSRAIVLPGKSLPLDQFGNIPSGFLKSLKSEISRISKKQIAARHAAKTAAGQRVREVAGRDRGTFYVPKGAARLLGGFWIRLPGHRISHLVAFGDKTSYKPRLGYHARVDAAARETWPKAMLARLHEAIRTAR